MFKEERNKNFPPIQMICDSQGCREVDLFGRSIKKELETLMSPEQLKELADREIKVMTRKEQIMDVAMFYAKKNENTPIPYLDFVEAAEWADRTMIYKACEWFECIDFKGDYFTIDSDDGCIFFNIDKFIEDFSKAMEE